MSGLPISVVIPALDEAASIDSAVGSALDDHACECIVVDGGSLDATVERAHGAGARVVSSDTGRSRQLNAGARVARHPLLVFLHADSVLPHGYGATVRRILADPNTACGAFRLRIQSTDRMLRAIAHIANLRAGRLALPYGDQALYVRADRFHQVGGFPDLPVMEDFEFVRRMRRTGRVALASQAVATSARRWRNEGMWRTTFRNQAAVLAYLGGVAPARIARWTGRDRRAMK